MKACEPRIDSLPYESKLNCGFKASLFFRTWSSIGSPGDPQLVNVQDITQLRSSHLLQSRIGTLKPLLLPSYKLRVPPAHVGKTMVQLDLRRTFQMLPFALETEDGVCTHFDCHTELMAGGYI